MGDGSDGLDVEHLRLGVGDRLAEEQLGVGAHRCFHDSMSLGSSTKLTWMPNLGSVCLSRL